MIAGSVTVPIHGARANGRNGPLGRSNRQSARTAAVLNTIASPWLQFKEYAVTVASPVGHRTIGSAQMGRFPEPETFLGEPGFIDVDAKPRRVGHRIGHTLQRGLVDERTVLLVTAIEVSLVPPGLKPGKIGHRGGEVNGRRRTDRTERVVRHHVDIMRLAPAGHFHGLGEAADIA